MAPRGFKVPVWITTSRFFRRVGPVVLPPFHRAVSRLTRGRTMFGSNAQPMLMLETIGATSNRRRETPIAAVPLAPERLIVVGTNFARETHPAWTANLIAHPRAEVVFNGERFAVDARLLSDAERRRIWPELIEWFPGWARYSEITDRVFRVFELTRVSPSDRPPDGPP